MKAWRRYGLWLRRLERLGYQHREELLNAADFGSAIEETAVYIVRPQTTPSGDH
jgi:hypothetical protein